MPSCATDGSTSCYRKWAQFSNATPINLARPGPSRVANLWTARLGRTRYCEAMPHLLGLGHNQPPSPHLRRISLTVPCSILSSSPPGQRFPFPSPRRRRLEHRSPHRRFGAHRRPPPARLEDSVRQTYADVTRTPKIFHLSSSITAPLADRAAVHAPSFLSLSFPPEVEP